MNRQCVIGLDFGTLSVRALAVDAETGRELATAVSVYPHGVMERALPDGTPLPEGFALADPRDYTAGIRQVIPQAMAQAGLCAADVIGLGLDCTSATVLPVDAQGRPLCTLPEWEKHPHAWVKLWKHHGAQAQAKRMQRIARERGEKWLDWCGGGVQSELLLPKALETAEEDAAVWAACARYLEMGDWLTFALTGGTSRSLSMASCNAYYQNEYPRDEYWRAVAPALEPVTHKLTGALAPLRERVGGLTAEWADALGLAPGTPVAAALIDSHASALGCGADEVGDLVAVLGTSACYLLNDSQKRGIPGVYSVAWEAHAPGLYGYEGGQSCVGDGLDWFVRTCVPASVQREADDAGENVHALLSRRAAALAPGGSGLMALDWLAGVRSPLMRPELRGVLVGATLRTTPEELYRAMVESCCFGARRVVDCYRDAGAPVKRFFATGGIPGKNPFLMQTLADVCGLEIHVCQSPQASALGAAIAAAGAALGDLPGCLRRMAAPTGAAYQPRQAAAFAPLYKRYQALCAAFEQYEE